jgi:hypothetical protein
MTAISRFVGAMRRRALHCYELLLYASLLALAVAAALAGGSWPQQDDVQCGNIQSSASVMVR